VLLCVLDGPVSISLTVRARERHVLPDLSTTDATTDATALGGFRFRFQIRFDRELFVAKCAIHNEPLAHHEAFVLVESTAGSRTYSDPAVFGP